MKSAARVADDLRGQRHEGGSRNPFDAETQIKIDGRSFKTWFVRRMNQIRTPGQFADITHDLPNGGFDGVRHQTRRTKESNKTCSRCSDHHGRSRDSARHLADNIWKSATVCFCKATIAKPFRIDGRQLSENHTTNRKVRVTTDANSSRHAFFHDIV